MKSILMLAALVLLPTLAAHAQTSTPVPAESTIPPAVDPPSATQAAADADEPQAKDDLADRNCLKETGSRIKPRADAKGRRCINAPGTGYTKEDLDRTGAIDLKDALRRLDPTVH